MATLRITIAAPVSDFFDAVSALCDGLDDVVVHPGSIFDIACDAMVSPANSFGFMDGGIDALYVDRFGPAVQDAVRLAILRDWHGELPVGAALIAPTGDVAMPWIIAAPTMRVPMRLPERSVAPYLAMRAALILIRHGRVLTGESAGKPVADLVRHVAVPGLGTGVGGLSPEVAAHQMRKAIDAARAPQHRLPTSWAEATEDHQHLSKTRPIRLQHRQAPKDPEG